MRDRSESTAIGVSVPIEPSASPPVRAIGATSSLSSSWVYPNVSWRRSTDSWLGTTCTRSGSVVQVHEPLLQPLGVGLRARELVLDLVVADDAALGGVDEEHAARLQPALLHDPRGVDVDARRSRWP